MEVYEFFKCLFFCLYSHDVKKKFGHLNLRLHTPFLQLAVISWPVVVVLSNVFCNVLCNFEFVLSFVKGVFIRLLQISYLFSLL